MSALAHLIGTLTVLALTLLVGFNGPAWEALEAALSYGEFWRAAAPTVLLQCLISAAIWAMVVLGFRWTTKLFARGETPLVVVKSRGAVMLETLIIFPTFLLLTGGLLQLTLNNTASVITTLASFQAGRTVMLWAPETDQNHGRMANNQPSAAEVRERARIAAASVLAAVAPADYGERCDSPMSPMAKAKLAAFTEVAAGGLGALGNLLGVAGTASSSIANNIDTYMGAMEAATADRLNVYTAFDSVPFALRGPVKFYVAYCNTTVNFSEFAQGAAPYNAGVQVPYIDTTVTYLHMQTVPWVGHIFSDDSKSVGVTTGVLNGQIGQDVEYTRITRTYSLPKLTNPNSAPPMSIDDWLSGDSSANPLNQDTSQYDNMGENTANGNGP